VSQLDPVSAKIKIVQACSCSSKRSRPGWLSCRSRSARWKGSAGRLELEAQDVGKSAFVGFDDGVGVVGDQPAQHGVGVLGVAQVPGAVQGMQARRGQATRAVCL
jgi:hypothetical protein